MSHQTHIGHIRDEILRVRDDPTNGVKALKEKQHNSPDNVPSYPPDNHHSSQLR